MLANDLVYRRSAKVNWDPVENTVLANEQVVEGRGWRSGAVVEQRELEQWFFRITRYGDDLLAALDGLDRWPDKVRTDAGQLDRQISRRKIWWEIAHAPDFLPRPTGDGGPNHATDPIEVFTTRPDTLFGAAFLALAADHPLTKQIAKSRPDVAKFMADCAARGTSEADIEKAEKVGIDLGIRVKHPFDPNWELPVWAANFVLSTYGSGAMLRLPRRRPARHRVRRKVWPALQARRAAAWRRSCDLRRLQNRLRRRRRDLQLRLPQWSHHEGSHHGRHQEAGRAGLGRSHHAIPPARLGCLTPALLGLPDPCHQVRHVRQRARARRPAARPAA